MAPPPVKRRVARDKLPTSTRTDDFSTELSFAGNGPNLLQRIAGVWERLRERIDPTDIELIEVGRAAKKNFAQRFSNCIAQKTADALRPEFPGIVPDEMGRGQESRSAAASGLKKIDVNFSTTRSGLELSISIKTINFKDEKTHRYTKNTKRVDGELRAEAQDCHQRQPYSVLVAYLFLPAEAATDGRAGASSLKHNADVLARRCSRETERDDPSLFELGFIGIYEQDGTTQFIPSNESVPINGTPESTIPFSRTLDLVRECHRRRNDHR